MRVLVWTDGRTTPRVFRADGSEELQNSCRLIIEMIKEGFYIQKPFIGNLPTPKILDVDEGLYPDVVRQVIYEKKIETEQSFRNFIDYQSSYRAWYNDFIHGSDSLYRDVLKNKHAERYGTFTLVDVE